MEFKQTLVEWEHILLELYVAVIRNEDVAYAVYALLTHLRVVYVPVAEDEWFEHLYEVLLDAPRSGNDHIDLLVLDEPGDDLSEAGRDDVRRVT